MSSPAKILLGVATLIQVPAIIALLTVDDFPTALGTLVVVLSFAVWFCYFWDLPRNELVPLEKEPDWRWALFLAPFAAEPIYFFRFIWRTEK